MKRIPGILLLCLVLTLLWGCGEGSDITDYRGITENMSLEEVMALVPEGVMQQSYYGFCSNSHGDALVMRFSVEYTVTDIHCYAKHSFDPSDAAFQSILPGTNVKDVVRLVGNPVATVENAPDTYRFEGNNGAVYHIQFGAGMGDMTDYEVISITQVQPGKSPAWILWAAVAVAVILPLCTVLALQKKESAKQPTKAPTGTKHKKKKKKK